MKFLENIFSIKNNSGKKIITILGLKIKISLFMFQRIKHFKIINLLLQFKSL